jgi:single-stranded-DNA-specific exonuclease
VASIRVVRRTAQGQSVSGGEHLHQLIQRIYLGRGVCDISQVDYRFRNLCHPGGLSNLDQAAKLIVQAIHDNRRMVIVGDFDADGATSSALMIRGLRQMGAGQVHFLVPNRFEYGYGLTPELVDELVNLRADLVITVDNGISSFRGVSKAKSLGMQVIITDHHLPPEELPPADAIVNPNCAGDEFPSKALAGVGVAFYLLAAVRAALRAEDHFARQGLSEPDVSALFDLVALGTVADLVPLDENNRIMVEAGLRLIRRERCVPGISALCKVAGVNQQQADSNSLAFYIAPRLNAAGRLEDMSIGIDLLLTDDPEEARKLAEQLQEINQQRKQIQQDMQLFADSVVDELKQKPSLPEVICLYHKNWHQGVVGLLASKVKEHTHRPVVAFAHESPGSQTLKGSVRSIKGLHIRDVLVEVDVKHPGVVDKFGGHAMAAGLSLQKSALPAFQQAFTEQVKNHLSEHTLDRVVLTDGSVDAADLSLHTAELIQQAGPWGQSFEEPMFDDWFIIKQKKLVGENHCKLVLQTTDLSKQIDAIAFGFHPNQFHQESQQTHLCYQLMVNEFRQRRRLQLKIEHIIR